MCSNRAPKEKNPNIIFLKKKFSWESGATPQVLRHKLQQAARELRTHMNVNRISDVGVVSTNGDQKAMAVHMSRTFTTTPAQLAFVKQGSQYCKLNSSETPKWTWTRPFTSQSQQTAAWQERFVELRQRRRKDWKCYVTWPQITQYIPLLLRRSGGLKIQQNNNKNKKRENLQKGPIN